MRYTILGASILAIAMSIAQAAEPGVPETTAPSVQVTNQLQAAPAISQPEADASELAYNFIEKGHVTEGWNSDKKIFVAVSEAIFDSEDPSYDDSFVTKRSLKTMEATLEAKKQIINYIHTEMSVMDKVSTPGTDLNAEFKGKMDGLKRKVDAQRRKVAKMLEDMDTKEADTLKGATFGDRANALMDAAIKKLDSSYSSANIEDGKRKKFENARDRYQKAMAEYQHVEKDLKKLEGSVAEELNSTVEAVSKMPLFGAMTMAQFESWNEDEEQYKVALVMTWSPKQEEMVRALITGVEKKVPAGRQSLGEYLKGQNWATATGGRKFRDSSGNFYILGIAASPVGSSSSSEKKARGMAEMMAKKEVVTALYADVAAKEKAEQAMITMNGGTGKDSSIAAESFASTLQQSLSNRQVQGLSKRYGKKVIHPLSGQKIYVSVYSIDSASIANAKLMMQSQYQTKLMDVKSQQKAKGVKDGYDQAIDTAMKDQSAYNQSRSASASSLQASVNPVKKPASNARQTTRQGDTSAQSSQSGSWEGGGNGNAEDAFGW